MKRATAGFLGALGLLVSGWLSGCQPAGPLSVAELVSQPDKYIGREVTVAGFYFSGFEISALAGGLATSASSPARLTPPAPLIWLTGDLGQGVYDGLYLQSDTPSGYPERYGRISVTGIFEYGGACGHLDAYRYRLTATGARPMPWSP